MSYYGTQARTVVPYAVALLALCAVAWVGARLAPQRWAARALHSVAVVTPVVLAMPYTVSRGVNIVHDVLAGLCFFAVFALAVVWGVDRGARRRSPVVGLLSCVVVAGSLLALVAFLRPDADILLGQLIALGAFLPLLVLVAD